MIGWSSKIACGAGIGLALAAGMSAARAGPGQQFRDFYGTWRGGGSALFSDGKRERLRCTAYYSGGTGVLKLAIRCASPSNKIEMRAALTANSETVTGEWEERTFNAAGIGTGRIADNSLNLKISGGVEGELAVSTDGDDQLVSVKSEGTALTGVNLKLKRSARP